MSGLLPAGRGPRPAPMIVALALVAVAPRASAQLVVPTYLGESGSLTDRYLDADEVRELLHAANGDLGQCFAEHMGPGEAGDVTLTLTVGGDGLPTEVHVEMDGGHDEVRLCLEDVAAGLRFPAHDGDPLAIGYPIVFLRDKKGDRTVPYPVVFVKPRARPFLMMNLPPTLTAEQRDLLERALYP